MVTALPMDVSGKLPMNLLENNAFSSVKLQPFLLKFSAILKLKIDKHDPIGLFHTTAQTWISQQILKL